MICPVHSSMFCQRDKVTQEEWAAPVSHKNAAQPASKLPPPTSCFYWTLENVSRVWSDAAACMPSRTGCHRYMRRRTKNALNVQKIFRYDWLWAWNILCELSPRRMLRLLRLLPLHPSTHLNCPILSCEWDEPRSTFQHCLVFVCQSAPEVNVNAAWVPTSVDDWVSDWVSEWTAKALHVAHQVTLTQRRYFHVTLKAPQWGSWPVLPSCPCGLSVLCQRQCVEAVALGLSPWHRLIRQEGLLWNRPARSGSLRAERVKTKRHSVGEWL